MHAHRPFFFFNLNIYNSISRSSMIFKIELLGQHELEVLKELKKWKCKPLQFHYN